MGECGCGNFNADLQLPGPDGLTYIIQVYPSCTYCDTPIGLIIHRMTSEQVRSWDAEQLPEPNWDDDNSTVVTILHPTVVLDVLRKLAGSGKSDEYEIDGFLQDHVGEAVREAVFRDDHTKAMSQ